MIACAVSWGDLPSDLGERMARSLGLFDKRPPKPASRGQAVLVAQNAVQAARLFQPGRSPSGASVLFDGWLDNRRELAHELGVPADDPATIYGAAVDRWRDEADLHAIGDYCAIILSPDGASMRLSRSPWSAPPLHYFQTNRLMAAASVVRVLHACGLPTTLNRRKLADNLAFNLTEDDGWYEGGFVVQPGTLVHLDRNKREVRRYYDHLAVRPTIRLNSPAEYVEAVDSLLDDVIRATLAGARRPGVLLSGGLDSPNIAARMLRAVPPEQGLDSFTFTPHPDWKGRLAPRYFADERPAVEALAAMYPGLRPHFSNNRDADFDTRMDALFLAMGMAPISLPNLAPLHSLYAMAREQGCDLMVNAGYGNATFSADGVWGFTEFLRKGKWWQLYQALRDYPDRKVSIPHAFLSLSLRPLAPLGLTRLWDRLRGHTSPDYAAPLVPLTPGINDEFAIETRKLTSRAVSAEEPRTSRRHTMADWFGRGEMQGGDLYRAFEQIHGIRTRDVTSYRPLMEFCHAIPTEIFLHRGQPRWLARELGRGLIPEETRTTKRVGQPGADWHMRLSRRLPEFEAELDAASRDGFLAEIIDFPALRQRLASFPDQPDGTSQEYVRHAMCLTRAVATARFVRHVNGGNAP